MALNESPPPEPVLAGSALTLHLVRHGQTTWNAEGRIQGQIDAPLSDLGRAQAHAAAAALADRPIGAVISSDLRRAADTAAAIAAPHGLTVALDPALRERGFGVVEGRLYREVEAEYGPGRWEALLHGSVDAIENGESPREHYDRVAAFMNRLRTDPPAQEVVLVSHGGTVRRIRSYLAGGFEQEDWSPIANGQILTHAAPIAVEWVPSPAKAPSEV